MNPINDIEPKCHRPVLVFREVGAEPVLARRTPDQGFIAHVGEQPLGWDPVGYQIPE
jgi:hypothetical protein